MLDIDYKSDPWPFKDELGFYQSKLEGGTWLNWWNRHKPSVISIFMTFMRSPDQSGISDIQRVEKNLPVTKPYWLLNGTEQEYNVSNLCKSFRPKNNNAISL